MPDNKAANNPELQSTARADYFIANNVNCTFVPVLGGVFESRLDVLKKRTIRRVAALYQKLDVLIMGIGDIICATSTGDTDLFARCHCRRRTQNRRVIYFKAEQMYKLL